MSLPSTTPRAPRTGKQGKRTGESARAALNHVFLSGTGECLPPLVQQSDMQVASERNDDLSTNTRERQAGHTKLPVARWANYRQTAETQLAQDLHAERADELHCLQILHVVSRCFRVHCKRDCNEASMVVFRFLYRKECFYRADVYDDQKELSYHMHAILVDWLLQVNCTYKALDKDPKVFFRTVRIVHKVLAHNNVSRNNFQLLGVAALLLSCKLEGSGRIPDLASLSHVTDKAYCCEQVRDMEENLLPLVGAVSPGWGEYHFLRHYCSLLELPPAYEELSEMLLARSFYCTFLCSLGGGSLAAAACLLAVKLGVKLGSFDKARVRSCTECLVSASGRRLRLLQRCAKRILTVADELFQSQRATCELYPTAWKLFEAVRALTN
eukprot:TRINITY_DN21509_c0_g1_i1.p1 TRINITY_DN21509_c0_g1~~TRINITY_DN21509_c0_g1_i1.p1  ORF type:complete len:384 (-),score=65.87 TRINITY_DN21509_c0_g1_i1:15-1166(-)